jgi:hypothetical protein
MTRFALGPFRLLPVALAAFVVWGCSKGPDLVPVSGQVLIDGQPLTAGHIQFIPENERPASGEIGADGRFTLTTYDDGDGCARGTHQIVVMASKQLSPTRTQHLAPPKYGAIGRSGLTATIDESTEDLKVELTWDGGRPYVEEINTGGDVAPIGTE